MTRPLLGALRECCEEVSFHKDRTLYTPLFRSAPLLDDLFDESEAQELSVLILKERFPMYQRWGVVDSMEEGKLSGSFTPEVSPVPLDLIHIHDRTNKKEYSTTGIFYWDPQTSRVNIVYPLDIETESLPFSSENIWGTEEIDRDSCLVELELKNILSLNQPQPRTCTVYNTPSAGEETINAVPGSFIRTLRARYQETT